MSKKPFNEITLIGNVKYYTDQFININILYLHFIDNAGVKQSVEIEKVIGTKIVMLDDDSDNENIVY